MHRMRQIAFSAMVIMILSLGTVAPAGSQGRRTLRFLSPVHAPSPSGPELHIAQVLGYFQEEDLDVTIT